MARYRSLLLLCLVAACTTGILCQQRPPTPPVYTNYLTSHFTWMDLVLDPDQFGLSGEGQSVYDYTNKREREDLLFSDSEAHITTYELYNQGKQYNVLKNTSGTYCSSQPIDSNMPAPNFLNTTCHWEGPGNIFMKKANRWGCPPMVSDNFYIRDLIWTSTGVMQDILRETVVIFLADLDVAIGSFILDIQLFQEQNSPPNSNLFIPPRECSASELLDGKMIHAPVGVHAIPGAMGKSRPISSLGWAVPEVKMPVKQ